MSHKISPNVSSIGIHEHRGEGGLFWPWKSSEKLSILLNNGRKVAGFFTYFFLNFYPLPLGKKLCTCMLVSLFFFPDFLMRLCYAYYRWCCIAKRVERSIPQKKFNAFVQKLIGNAKGDTNLQGHSCLFS